MVLAVGAACTRVPPPTTPGRDLDGPARMVLTEHWRDHGRLIIVDETGDRLAPLLEPGTTAAGAQAADEHPAFSPDGRWIVFASNRGRDDAGRSVWIAAAVPDAVPRRLTSGTASDIDPIWDGPASIVFASDRAGEGSLDLFRLAVATSTDGGRAAGEPARLTDAPTHEVSPTAAGGRLVLQVVDAAAGRSWIAERVADGALVAITDGPGDGSPALAADGTTLALVSAVVHADGERDLDVIVTSLDDAAPLRARGGLALAGSDEGAPAWSADGRWLFATSVIRDADGQPLLPSVIHRDTWADPARVRMLRDTAGAAPRLGAALAPVALDHAALARNLDHTTALRDALLDLAERQNATQKRQASD